MRRHLLALLLPFVVVACASRPQKPAGRYAIVLDPQLTAKRTVRGVTPLHHSVREALTQRLNVVANPADADAVIVLEPAPYGRLAYEIRRGDTVVAQSDPMVIPSRVTDRDTIGEQLEAQRRDEKVREERSTPLPHADPLRPHVADFDIGGPSPTHAEAVRIAEQIVYDLSHR
ncbi:MAG TPA: hypothetical protein VM733_11975 [Thermoanaerobaculia bacterium]|nr:hypothetical protein [Thermoanaerobaculia bacterium]